LLGELIAGRYEVEELLGTGGMSSVYLARDNELERRVTVKVLHEQHARDRQFVERFRREARAMARLAHPNVVTVIDRGDHEGRDFIVFEHVAGESLKDLLERQGPLTVADAVRVAQEAARGLAFAHQHGIVHRDVKPHNVLVAYDGAVKVTDFGIARSLDPEEALTETGTVLGTSDYISPEQAFGKPIDHRSDQYSLGILLYELLTGEVPYPGRNLGEIALRHLRDPVPSLRERRPDVPAELDAIVQRALAKRPEDRFPSTEEFISALEAVGPLPAAPSPPLPRLRPAGRLRRRSTSELMLVAGIALALAAVVGGALASRGGDGETVGAAKGPGGAATRLSALADFDPEGDGREHPEDVPAATDGDPATYWTTEGYRSFQKSGVGLVLDAGGSVDLEALVVRSDEPGFQAEVRASNRPDAGFVTVSGMQTVGAQTVFPLAGEDEYRYYLLWITDPNGRAHVNEVRAR
jgi:eukaryotic-like serine/threonine-protein kinase